MTLETRATWAVSPPPPAWLRPGPTPRIAVLVPASQAAATIGERIESARAATADEQPFPAVDRRRAVRDVPRG